MLAIEKHDDVITAETKKLILLKTAFNKASV